MAVRPACAVAVVISKSPPAGLDPAHGVGQGWLTALQARARTDITVQVPAPLQGRGFCSCVWLMGRVRPAPSLSEWLQAHFCAIWCKRSVFTLLWGGSVSCCPQPVKNTMKWCPLSQVGREVPPMPSAGWKSRGNALTLIQPPSGCWERADSSRGQLVLEPSEPRFITMAGSFWGPRLCPAALTSSLLVCQGAQQPGSITGCWCRAG